MNFLRILLQGLVEDAFALFQILSGRQALFHLLQILGRKRALSRFGLRFQSKKQGVLWVPIEKLITNRQAFLDPVLRKYGTGFLKCRNLSLDLGMRASKIRCPSGKGRLKHRTFRRTLRAVPGCPDLPLPPSAQRALSDLVPVLRVSEFLRGLRARA